jgi:hypothetical protein
MITTPAGSFACTEYRGFRSGAMFARTWYAPGVGFLGSESARALEVDGETRQGVFRRRLASFVLN